MPDDSTSTSAIPLIAGSLVLAALFLLAGISLSDGWTERFARAYRRSSRKWRLRAKARRVQRESERLRRDLQAIAAASPAQKMARHPEKAEFEPEPDEDEGEKVPDPYSPIFVVVIPQAASQPRPGTLLQEDEPTGLNLQDAVERRMLVRYLCGDFGKVWE
jgi:hypothetical protein